MAGRLEAVWVKRSHRGPMDACESAILDAGQGLSGSADRGGRRQVTLLSADRWGEVCRTLGVAVPPSARRANVLVSGIELKGTAGRVLRLGGCRLRIRGETRPCERMDEAQPGLRVALEPEWGGGAFAEILEGGEIRVGDEAAWED